MSSVTMMVGSRRAALWLVLVSSVVACTDGEDEASSDGSETGGTGGSSAGASGGGTGGSTSTGGAGAAGSAGVSGSAGRGASGSGGMGASGPGGRGGSSGSAGSSAGAGSAGGPTCANDVDFETDSFNCGECGRVCKNTENVILSPICDPGECCIAGECQPYIATECLEEGDPYDDCASFCPSIGEECVEGGCGSGSTWMGWPRSNSLCEGFSSVLSRSSGACDDPIEWSADVGKVRCCCTDTQP